MYYHRAVTRARPGLAALRFRFAGSQIGRIRPLVASYSPPFKRHSKITTQRGSASQKAAFFCVRTNAGFSGEPSGCVGSGWAGVCGGTRRLLSLQPTSRCGRHKLSVASAWGSQRSHAVTSHTSLGARSLVTWPNTWRVRLPFSSPK